MCLHSVVISLHLACNLLTFPWELQAVLKMLSEIGSVENIPDFIEGVKNR